VNVVEDGAGEGTAGGGGKIGEAFVRPGDAIVGVTIGVVTVDEVTGTAVDTIWFG